MESQPTRLKQRLNNLDTIRGIAVLGILIMNIQAFSMVQAAYSNPTSFGDLSGVNFWIYYFSHIFADQKFMTIFSILFGAGIVLMSNNIENRGGDAKRIHCRRMYLLAGVGLLHLFFIWWGDILFAYAIAGLIVFNSKDKAPKVLLKKGLIHLAVCSIILVLLGLAISSLEGDDLKDIMQVWAPTSEEIASEIAEYKQSWLEQSGYRLSMALEMLGSLLFYIFRITGLMYLGMALFKLGFYGDSFKDSRLKLHAVISLAVGLTVTIIGSFKNFNANWHIDGMFLTLQYGYWGSVAIAYGYLCLLVLFCRTNTANYLKKLLANVGKMALTNYLLQSIICSVVFYGWGLGLFGELERYQQLLVVFGVWALLIIFSNIWMNYFRFGLFEWMWRSLTYNRLQPLKA